MSFVQALLSMGYRPVPLAGAPTRRSSTSRSSAPWPRIADRDDDVLLVSNDGDFVEGFEACSTAAAGSASSGSREFRNHEFTRSSGAAWSRSTWSTTSRRSPRGSPRVRIIPIDEFDPLDFL